MEYLRARSLNEKIFEERNNGGFPYLPSFSTEDIKTTNQYILQREDRPSLRVQEYYNPNTPQGKLNYLYEKARLDTASARVSQLDNRAIPFFKIDKYGYVEGPSMASSEMYSTSSSSSSHSFLWMFLGISLLVLLLSTLSSSS